jgi:hypothetical protein
VTATEPVPTKERVYDAVPYQRLSLLILQFWLSADMPHYYSFLVENQVTNKRRREIKIIKWISILACHP